MAEGIVKACIGRAALQHGRIARIKKEVLEPTVRSMAEATRRTDESPTFRKGKAGGWRKWFDEEMIALWKEHDPDDWIGQLGYEW